jgi:hypothetical protein
MLKSIGFPIILKSCHSYQMISEFDHVTMSKFNHYYQEIYIPYIEHL